MTITATAAATVDVEQSAAKNTDFTVNFYSASGAGGEIIKADPGAGYHLAITMIAFNCAADDTVSFREDSTVILGPFTFKAAGGNSMAIIFPKPILLTANKELQVITGTTSAVAGVVQGYVTV